MPSGGSGLSGGDLPVSDATDVLREMPEIIRRPATAPVRDAFCEAIAETHRQYQDSAAYSAAQCDPTRATGDYLVSLALEREVVPTAGETEADLRARLFSAEDLVSPQAIINRLNALLSPHTDKLVHLVELELDGWFVHNGTAEWDSFVGVDPRYPDRFYVDDADENDGFYIEQNQPGGAVPSNGLKRCFHIRIPVLDAADEEFAFAIDADDEIMAIGDGSDTSAAESDGTGATSVFTVGATAEELCAAIVGIVDSIKGQGISWSAMVDPEL